MILKRIALLFTITLFAFMAVAQVIPDLTKGDHFLPNLSETEKQELIVKSFQQKTNGKVPNTSEKLYPHLYQSTNKDYLGPIRGTSADPANAFKDYSKMEYMTPTRKVGVVTPSVSSALYNNQLSIQERNRLEVEADMKAYEEQKKYKERLLAEAYKEFAPEINYHLGLHTGGEVDRYVKAYEELRTMLNGNEKIDFLKAVWLIESAVDPSLTWEEFNGMFQDGLQVIIELMRQDKLSAKDNLAKLMSIYKFMSDTTKVFIASKEKTVISKPMLYDFEDYAGEKDPTKVFVSKLLRTGTGQCMSLPMLYYLFAKALGADASLALAPEHSYITFKDNLGKRQNIELTGRMFTTTDFYWQTGVIKTEQTKSGIYLTPLSEKETLAELLATLSKTYVKRFGVDNRLLEMAVTAKQHHPNSLSANMLLVGYTHALWKHVLRQYDVYDLSDEQLAKDEKAQTIKRNKELAYNYLMKDLGYAKMPDWAYQAWLKGVNELANKQQHIVRKRQLEHQLNK
jgi:hypothetical protein